MNNPVSGVRSNVSNIHDNIGEMIKKYDIGSYLEKSEVGKYIEDKSPLKDLVMKIKELLGWVSDILDKIFALIDAILAFLEWLFDSIMDFLKELLMLIFSFLEGFGFHIGFRNSILDALLSDCFSNSGNKFNPDPITGFILGALLGFSICEEDATAYSRLYNGYQENDKELQEINNELYSATIQLDTYTNTPQMRDLNRKIAECELNILIRLSAIDEDAAYLKEKIESYNSKFNSLLQEYSDVNNGKIMGNLTEINRDISLLSAEIEGLTEDLQVLIDSSTDADVVGYRDEISEYEKQLNAMDVSRDDRYWKYVNRVRAAQQRKADRMVEIDEMFRRIAKTQITITGKSEKVTTGVYIASILDLMSTSPGYEAVRLYSSLGEVMADSIAYKLSNSSSAGSVFIPYKYVNHTDKLSVLKEVPSDEIEKASIDPNFISDIKNSDDSKPSDMFYPTIVQNTDEDSVTNTNDNYETFNFKLYGMIPPKHSLLEVDNAISKLSMSSAVNGLIIAGTGSKTYLHKDPTIVTPNSSIYVMPIESLLSSEQIANLIKIYKEAGYLTITDDRIDLYRRPLIRSILSRLIFDKDQNTLQTNEDVVVGIDGKPLYTSDGDSILKTETGYALSGNGEMVITGYGYITLLSSNNMASSDNGEIITFGNGDPIPAYLKVHVLDSDGDYKIDPNGDLYMNRDGDICITRDTTNNVDRYRYPILNDNGYLELKRSIIPELDGDNNIILSDMVLPKLDSSGKVINDDLKGYKVDVTNIPLYTEDIKSIISDSGLVCTTDTLEHFLDSTGYINLGLNIVLLTGTDSKPLLSQTGDPFYLVRNGNKIVVTTETVDVFDTDTRRNHNDSLDIAILAML